MDSHLLHVVHFLDSEWNRHHRHLNVSTIQTEIYIVIYDVLLRRSSTIGPIERELDCQQGIDLPKFRIESKLSFVLEIHMKNLDENSLIQNQMKNLILVISVDKKCNYINVVYKNWKMSLKESWQKVLKLMKMRVKVCILLEEIL